MRFGAEKPCRKERIEREIITEAKDDEWIAITKQTTAKQQCKDHRLSAFAGYFTHFCLSHSVIYFDYKHVLRE